MPDEVHEGHCAWLVWTNNPIGPTLIIMDLHLPMHSDIYLSDLPMHSDNYLSGLPMHSDNYLPDLPMHSDISI